MTLRRIAPGQLACRVRPGSAAAHRAPPYSPSPPNSHFEPLKRAPPSITLRFSSSFDIKAQVASSGHSCHDAVRGTDTLGSRRRRRGPRPPPPTVAATWSRRPGAEVPPRALGVRRRGTLGRSSPLPRPRAGLLLITCTYVQNLYSPLNSKRRSGHLSSDCNHRMAPNSRNQAMEPRRSKCHQTFALHHRDPARRLQF